MNERKPIIKDEINSMFAWKIRIAPEHDYRKIKTGRLIIEGYSKCIGWHENPDLVENFISKLSMMEEKNFLKNSDYIKIWTKQPKETKLLQPIDRNLVIFTYNKAIENPFNVDEMLYRKLTRNDHNFLNKLLKKYTEPVKLKVVI